jgi:mRNA-degrading endonuclease RelE of RelBE toxin-antitoxin system
VPYSIGYDGRAIATLQALPKRTRDFVMLAIEELMIDPEPEGSELVEEDGEWIHVWGVGRFLIYYEIYERRLVVMVVSVTKSKD